MTVSDSAPAIIAGDPAAPLPDAITGILAEALMEGATDVHVDSWSGGAALRYRVDGAVQEKEPLTPQQADTIINQIKIAAGLDVNITQTPLDGHFRIIADGLSRGIRATVIPTAPHHRSAHLRLLGATAQLLDVGRLGMSGEGRGVVESVMGNPRGLVLVVGPTGAGKTTTLYALAQMGDARREVIASIEDPVEFDLPAVRQLEANREHGVTMHEGLRALLRMDPDVILVGEVADRESASIAAQAALAGRLVIATIHGRDPATAVEAMHYLAVPYYILGGALRLIVAQSLVRLLCPACRRSRDADANERRLFERHGMPVPAAVHEPVGCARCHGYGYKGRTGVFEVVLIDDETAMWVSTGQHHLLALRERLRPIAASAFGVNALSKVADGTTSLREVASFFGELTPDSRAER
jgi:general secretion pathway protein E